MLDTLPRHDFFVMVHKGDGHIVNQVLDGASTHAAQEVAEILAIFLEFAVNVHIGAAQIAEHATHIAIAQDAKFNGVFHIQDAVANIVGGLHQIHQRVAHPLARFHFRDAQRVCRNAVKVCFSREQACRRTELGKLRILDHGAQSRISESHATIQKMVFQLAQNAMALRIAVKIFKVGNFSVVQVAERCRIAVLAEPFANGGFTGVAKRRVADIVRQACGLYNRSEVVFVDILGQILFNQVVHRNGKASAHTRNFDTVRKAAMHVVVHRERMHLSLTAKAPKCRRKNNAVIIAVKIRTVRVQIGGVPVTRRRKQSIPLKHGQNIDN